MKTWVDKNKLWCVAIENCKKHDIQNRVYAMFNIFVSLNYESTALKCIWENDLNRFICKDCVIKLSTRYPSMVSKTNKSIEEKDAYFSSNEYIFFRAASHGRFGSSTKVETRFSNFIKSWYSKAASLSASAFPSGQSKCLRTARSSTLHKE